MKANTLKLILLAGFFTLALAILNTKSKHEVRMEKIELLQAEAFDSDLSKFEATETAINSLLKKIDKEYSITDDFDSNILLIDERESLISAKMGNRVKGILIEAGRIRNTLKASVLTYKDLPIDPGRSGKTEKINFIHNSENKGFDNLHIDPGRNI